MLNTGPSTLVAVMETKRNIRGTGGLGGSFGRLHVVVNSTDLQKKNVMEENPCNILDNYNLYASKHKFSSNIHVK
jgi:hypothetical protein